MEIINTNRANDSVNLEETRSGIISDYRDTIDLPVTGNLNGRIDLINGVLPCVFDTEGEKNFSNIIK